MAERKNKTIDLQNKVAIVTGGAYGIGRALCLGLAAHGARVVVADIVLKAARETADEIEAGGSHALALKTDVSKVEDTLAMAKEAIKRFGKIDILVNNAALSLRAHMPQKYFYDMDIADWDRVIAVNLKGPFLCARAVFPYMKKQNTGKIINIGSGTFYQGPEFIAHYIASKGGLIGLTRTMATELGPFNITANCVAPGRTLSEDPDNKEALKLCKKRAMLRALKRVEYPEDLVGAVVFFASSASDFITGQTLVVDGGHIKH
jgi:3-oxoacyl-[acyl-carrier protein] reductase